MGNEKKRSKRATRLIIILAAVFLLVGAISIAVVATLNSRPFQEETVYHSSQSGNSSGTNFSDSLASIESTAPEFQEKSMNILVCGLDKSEFLTDVIMLVNFDIERNKVNVVQIPRDTFIGDRYIYKINTIYGHPIDGDTRIGGLMRVINETLAVPIDHYITITLDSFQEIVDAMGGIEVDMPYQINYLPGKVIPEGKQVLDGEKAEWLVRYRAGYANADLGRINAQQMFLKAALQRVKDLGRREMSSIVDDYYKDITTDFSLGEISDLAGIAIGLTMEDLEFATLPGYGAWYGSYAVYELDVEQTADILNDLMRPYSDPVSAEELNISLVPNSTQNGGTGGNYGDGAGTYSENSSSTDDFSEWGEEQGWPPEEEESQSGGGLRGK